MRKRLAAVVPCYNAGGRVEPVVRGLLAQLEHVVVVDDGSTDGATAPLQALGASVIQFPENKGKGFAMLAGFRAALAADDVTGVVIVDADGQHDAGELPNLWETFTRDGADLVIGTRTFDGAHVPWRSKIGNRFTAMTTRLLIGAAIPDTQSGFRIHSRRLLEDILKTIRGGRYETEMEILVNAAKGGYKIAASPIRTIYETGNPSSHFNKYRDSWRVIRKLFGAALRRKRK
ncbi:MAG: glycosyltransferase family 2 protein [Candidatus Hydrogenedentes bacterium]|nr:glycosyltransferase family 2 protein [Candidatus Hydrogenedentota bacterium]